MESNPPQTITGKMLKKMIEDILQGESPLPLDAEPQKAGEQPPEIISEENVISYKGNTPERDWALIANKALIRCDDKQRKRVFDNWSVKTYEQFLDSVERYERAKKPK
jgi:hypothetical protein